MGDGEEGDGRNPRRSDGVLDCYGVVRFLSDIDACRPYPGGGIVGDVLRALSGPDFPHVAARFNLGCSCALEMRQRFTPKAGL